MRVMIILLLASKLLLEVWDVLYMCMYILWYIVEYVATFSLSIS